MSDETAVAVVEEAVILEPQEHGGALLRSGGPGRPQTKTGALQYLARTKLRGAIELAGNIVRDTKASVEDRMRAAEFLRRCTGMDREKPIPRKRSTFSVVHATPEEQVAKLSPAIDPPAAEETAPAKPIPAQGPPESEKSILPERVRPT